METLDYLLPQVWFAILVLFLFLYVVLDGFDEWGFFPLPLLVRKDGGF